MSAEDHGALKRWERARQMSGLVHDPPMAGPPAWCRIRPLAGGPSEIPVFILEIFNPDLVCVKACAEPAPTAMPGPIWMVRGGISWEDYLPGVVDHYRAGLPVPQPFKPRKKIAPVLLDHLKALPREKLPEVFLKMREEGMLPALPGLTKHTCPVYLPWAQLRAHFQDFRET